MRARRPARPVKAVGRVYRSLLERFGPQGWWPVRRGGKSAPSYRPGRYGPRSAAEMFEICAGALLTQNTAWTNAAAALDSLARSGNLEPGRISALRPDRLAALIRSSGYFRQKAGRLRELSRHMLRRHPEGIRKWFSRAAAEELRAELLEIRGIGPETADSMVLYAAGKPKFVVDAYTARIFGRLGVLSGNYCDLQASFEASLPKDHRIYNEYHALIVALGKEHCLKTRPLCGTCPLKSLCRSAGSERI